MYKFSETIVFGELVGCEIIQICIGENEFIINLYPDGCCINILSIESFYKENVRNYNNDEFYMIKELLGKKILGYEILSPEKLKIIISSENILIITDETDDYESAIFETDRKSV